MILAFTVFEEVHVRSCGCLRFINWRVNDAVCEKRLINDAGCFEARYIRGGLDNQSPREMPPRVISSLIASF